MRALALIQDSTGTTVHTLVRDRSTTKALLERTVEKDAALVRQNRHPGAISSYRCAGVLPGSRKAEYKAAGSDRSSSKCGATIIESLYDVESGLWAGPSIGNRKARTTKRWCHGRRCLVP